MTRKLIVIAFTAMLALVLLPTTAASAATTHGYRVSCFGIKKHGNYNSVIVGIKATVSGGYVSAYANLGVSARCQRVNSIPVTKMYIYGAYLKTSSGRILASVGETKTASRSLISRQTRYAYVPCGTYVHVSEKISYTYYDRSHVRPFYVGGPSFRRC